MPLASASLYQSEESPHSWAAIDCTVEAEHDGGDHLIVVGRVHGLEIVREGRPLLFYRGGYGRFAV